MHIISYRNIEAYICITYVIYNRHVYIYIYVYIHIISYIYAYNNNANNHKQNRDAGNDKQTTHNTNI